MKQIKTNIMLLFSLLVLSGFFCSSEANVKLSKLEDHWDCVCNSCPSGDIFNCTLSSNMNANDAGVACFSFCDVNHCAGGNVVMQPGGGLDQASAPVATAPSGSTAIDPKLTKPAGGK